jgi:hypothetical protein
MRPFAHIQKRSPGCAVTQAGAQGIIGTLGNADALSDANEVARGFGVNVRSSCSGCVS